MYIREPLVKTDKGCIMFTVQPLCRRIILSVYLIITILINMTAKDLVLVILSAVFFVWRWRNLTTLKIYISGNCLIRQTGKTFKQKNIITLKNISQIQIFVIHTRLPAFVRLQYYNKTLYILYLNGEQWERIENYILRLK